MIYRVIFAWFLMVSAQMVAQDKAEKAIQNLDQNYPQEKVYMMLNKESYAAGESLWFKAFVFDGYAKSDVSTTLFVELYDANKKLVDKKMIPLYNSEGQGNFALPDAAKESVYYIRAYTTWMTNFNENYQYIKSFAVYNPTSPEKLIDNDTAEWKATAYPESGTFVEGINTKFAVRLQSKGTTPTAWSGYVIDKDKPNAHMVDFKGYDQNVGAFSITPEKGKSYQLMVQDSKGNKKTIDLPMVAESGVNLQVTSNSTSIDYSLQSHNVPDDAGYYKIIATIGNKLVYKARIKKNSNGTVSSIPTNQLINGVLQFTLFDEKENVVLQRLCFVQPQTLNLQKPTLQSLALNPNPRAKNSFEIATNANIQDYTVAIYDASKVNQDDNLLSAFWLTGDFTDHIYSPAQYFANNRNTDALDALLISEQWKRFNWTDLMMGKFPIIKNKPDRYLTYNIRVTTNGRPAQNSNLSLMMNGDNTGFKLFTLTTDNNGDFSLKNMAFNEPQKIYYQLKAPNTNAIVLPKESFVPLKGDLPQNQFLLAARAANEPLTPAAEQAIEGSRFEKKLNDKITDIEEVKLTATKTTPTEKLNEELSSPLFQSASESIYDFVNDPTLSKQAPDILMWLQGRIPGLQLHTDDIDPEFYMRNRKIDIYLDEVKSDTSFLRGINLNNIAMIKVINDNFAGGFGNGDGGAILIYTRTGSSATDTDNKSGTGVQFFSLAGYDKEDPFKNPDYSTEAARNVPSDSRSNLYWNPYLKPEIGQPAKVNFYNNDTAKKYKVIIIGLDNNNQLPLFYQENLP